MKLPTKSYLWKGSLVACLFGLFILGLVFLPTLQKPASADVNFTLTWQDSSTIKVSGSLSGTIITSGSDTQGFGGSVSGGPNGCTNLSIVVSSSNKTATIQPFQASSGGGASTESSNLCYGTYFGSPSQTSNIPISGTRPTTESHDEEATTIALGSDSIPIGNAPNSVTFTFHSGGSKGSVVGSPVKESSNTTYGFFTGVDYGPATVYLTPGQYTVCFSALAGCQTFTKVSGKPYTSNVSANPAIVVDVTDNYLDPNGAPITLGPIGVTIQQTGQSTTHSIQTNTLSLPANSSLEGAQSVGTTSPGALTATYLNASPGTYNVCLAGSTSGSNCSSVTVSSNGNVSPNPVTLNNDPGLVAAANGGSSSSSNSTSSCEASGGPFSWFICAALDTLGNVEQKIISLVQTLLQTKPVDFTEPSYCSNQNSPQYANCTPQQQLDASIYSVWSSFRLYGDILLVIALLGAIIIEAAGGGSVAEAYTVKRMLPRILAAAILINLSIYIVAAAEDVINILGNGVRGLLLAPFSGINGAQSGLGTGNFIHVSGSTGVLGTLGLGGIALAAGFTEGIAGIAIFVLGGFVIAALGVLITIMVRQALLVILLLTSPVAFALYVLPNTEQYFRKWWGLLLKTLLVYPIVMAVVAGASIAALIMSNFGIQPTILNTLIAIMAAAAPLFLIPFAFKLSGGVIGQVSNAVSGIQNRAKEPLRNFRKQNRANRMEKARNDQLYKGNNRFSRRAGSIAMGASMFGKAGLNPLKMRRNLTSAMSTHRTALAAKAAENEAVAAFIGDDDMLNAYITNKGDERAMRDHFRGLGMSDSEITSRMGILHNGQTAMGKRNFNLAAAAALAGTGPGYASGQAEMFDAINWAAEGDSQLANRTVIAARGYAERARRGDLAGSGAAETLRRKSEYDSVDEHGNRKLSAADLNRQLAQEVLKTKSAAEIANYRGNAFKNVSGGIAERAAETFAAKTHTESVLAEAQEAHANGQLSDSQLADVKIWSDNANRNYIAAMAHTAAILDHVGGIQENAAAFAGVVGSTIEGNPDGPTISAEMERLEKGDTPESKIFRQFKKVYTTVGDVAGATGENRPPPPPA